MKCDVMGRGVRWDLSGPERVSLAEIITAYRRWLGFGETRLLRVPRWMARPAFLFGDLLGWLGIKTAMRTNSLKQLDFDVEGDLEESLDVFFGLALVDFAVGVGQVLF